MNHEVILILLAILGTLYVAGMVWAFRWNPSMTWPVRLVFTLFPPLLLLIIWFMNRKRLL